MSLRPPINIRSKGQRSRSQGQQVQKVATRQPSVAVSSRCIAAQRLSRVYTRQHVAGQHVASSNMLPATIATCCRATCCLVGWYKRGFIEGDRVVGVSYALYGVPSL